MPNDRAARSRLQPRKERARLLRVPPGSLNALARASGGLTGPGLLVWLLACACALGCSSSSDSAQAGGARNDASGGAPAGGAGGGSAGASAGSSPVSGGSTAAGGASTGGAAPGGGGGVNGVSGTGNAGTSAGASGAPGSAGRPNASGGSGGANSSTAGASGSAQVGGSGSGSAGSAGAASSADQYASARQACVDRINGFRATLSLPPVARWTVQEKCADSQAQSDSSSGTAHGAFGTCKESAQNECPGWGSVDQTIQGCLQQMWDEGPGEPYSAHGHYINMSNKSYTQVACGFYQIPGGKVWAVQDFH